jgi:hypothetical protein
MKIEKRILSKERLRQCPAQFSFVDHRLVRAGYLRRASVQAWALYLVLVTVGDEHGLSYYSEPSLARLLSLSVDEITAGRRQLVHAGVIADEEPLYQVLALDPALASEFAREGGGS